MTTATTRTRPSRGSAPSALLAVAKLVTCCALLGLAAAPLASAEISADACAGGVAYDDGTAETGYGFVPSATEGIYVQEFDSEAFPSRALETVCVCWLKTRYGRDVDFAVVFYEDRGGAPARTPYATVPASASGLPESKAEAGAFWAVDVSGTTLPAGKSYIGVRWDPSQAKFLFVCTDTSEATEPTSVFFREDRAPGWVSVFRAKDPIFRPHRAILLRARTRLPASSVPDASAPPTLEPARN